MEVCTAPAVGVRAFSRCRLARLIRLIQTRRPTPAVASKNGKHLGDAYTISDKLKGQALFPAVTLKNAELHFNFGATPFKHPPAVGQPSFSSLFLFFFPMGPWF